MLPRRDRPLVLVAVAQPELRAVLSHLFRDAHYDVLFAEDGVSVVTTAARSGPDAVVLDVELPRLDGLVALELLRAADDAVPAVILTAVSGPAILSAAERLHAAAVLRKPFRNADLLAAVARSLAEIPRPPSLTG